MPDSEEERLLRDLAPGVDLPASRQLLRIRRARRARRRVLLAAAGACASVVAGVTFALASGGSPDVRIDTADPSVSTTSTEVTSSSSTAPSSTTTSTGAASGVCQLGATFSAGPAGWDMTVDPGPGPGGDGPPTWWHIAGPEEGRVIQILRGSSPFPPADPPTPTIHDGLSVSVYEVHEGYGATIAAADADLTDPCAELHLLGFGVTEADLRSVAMGVILTEGSSTTG